MIHDMTYSPTHWNLQEPCVEHKLQGVCVCVCVGGGVTSVGDLSRVRKVAHFPICMNLKLLFLEIFDCKE